MSRHGKRGAAVLATAVAAAAVIIGWHSIVMLPFKLLTVFFHELSHAIATVLTGGRVVGFELSPQQGGQVMSVGGNRFITLSAGYLGSLLWGVLLFAFAHRSRADRWASGTLALIMLAVWLFFSTNGFAVMFCAAGALAFGLLALFGNHMANDLALRVVGTTCMLYVPLDIISDTLIRSALRSDARMLAEEFGGTTWLWGGLWLVAAILTAGWMIMSLWRRP